MGPVICPYCNPELDEIVLDNKPVYVRFDKLLVSPCHMLIIPRRNIPSVFEATTGDLTDFRNLISMAKQIREERYSPGEFNIGINDGE